MKLYEELGTLVSRRWSAQNYREAAFPQIAEEALREVVGDRVPDCWEVVRWLVRTSHLPQQMDPGAQFGQPPITVFKGSQFHIDVLFWVDATTAVHEHAFAGAFQVIAGSSIHARYSFHEDMFVNTHFRLGKTRLESVEHLKRGDIRTIHPGSQFVHSLFHLERPSVTLIIRTPGLRRFKPQWRYAPPNVAYDEDFTDSLTSLRELCAQLLLTVGHPDGSQIIGDMIRSADLFTTYVVLRVCHNMLGLSLLPQIGKMDTSGDFRALLDIARKRHGAVVERFVEVFEEEARQADIVGRRQLVRMPEHRLFLALLLNVPDRGQLLELVQEVYPDNLPLDTIEMWIEELVETRALGARESNVLGLEHTDAPSLLVLRGLLEGLPAADIGRMLEDEFPGTEGLDLEAVMAGHRRCVPLQALLAGCPQVVAVPAGQ